MDPEDQKLRSVGKHPLPLGFLKGDELAEEAGDDDFKIGFVAVCLLLGDDIIFGGDNWTSSENLTPFLLGD